MAAARALVAKELRQHGPSLLGLSVLLAAAWWLAHASFERGPRTLSALETVASFGIGPLVAAALYLGHRLVVMEHYGHTQRFVESLPVRRGQLALVKAAFGLFWLELWAFAALVAGARVAAASEPVGGHFLAVMAARLGVYVLALWGVVFLLGFFGRLRVILGGALAALVWLLDHTTVWQVGRFGPLALIDRSTFAFERQQFPTLALAQAAAVGLGAFAVAFGLARVREGSIVESLARRLSPREIYALAIVMLGASLAYAALDKEPPPRPYALTTDRVLRGTRARLEIAYFEDDLRPAAERLLAELEPTLVALAPALRLPPLPPVKLVHAPELGLDAPRTVQLHETEGLVLRLNLAAPPAEPLADTVALVIHQLLWARTHGHAGIEAKHWLLDGFTLHFALFGTRAAAPPLAAADPWALRALAGAEMVPLGADALAHYHLTAERLGDLVTDALAASGWRVLEARVGRERVLALARAALTRRGTGDVRDFLHGRLHPLPALFERETGVAWTAFLTDWSRALADLRGQPAAAAALASLPRGPIAVVADRASSGLVLRGQLTPPPAAGTACRVLHQKLPPYDMAIMRHDLEEIPLVWEAGQTRLDRPLELEYGRGERAFVAFECQLAPLGVPVRLGAWRVTLP